MTELCAYVITCFPASFGPLITTLIGGRPNSSPSAGYCLRIACRAPSYAALHNVLWGGSRIPRHALGNKDCHAFDL
jgi:hypothetical protein